MKTSAFPVLHTPNKSALCDTFCIDVGDLDKVWFSSDLHFFHKNVIAYCNRPFHSVGEMHSNLISNFNQMVDPDHTLFLLGDICFGGKQRWMDTVSLLNGKKILIRGNHDGLNYNPLISLGIDPYLYGNLQIMDGDKVLDSLNLSHYPYAHNGDGDNPVERYTERRIIDDGNVLLHGHVHLGWKTKAKMINVGVDMWDMKPVNLRDLWKLAKSLE